MLGGRDGRGRGAGTIAVVEGMKVGVRDVNDGDVVLALKR